MSVSVLVVDDSGFFRKRVCEILNSVPEIKIVGTASNGREAIELVKARHPDVVTMDYEMPVMDGVTAVRNIMAECPTPILMFSSLTYEGARVTLDALEAGAVDFLPKNFEDIARDAGKMQEVLKKRILTIAQSSHGQIQSEGQTSHSQTLQPAEPAVAKSGVDQLPSKAVNRIKTPPKGRADTLREVRRSPQKNNAVMRPSSEACSVSTRNCKAQVVAPRIGHSVELLVIGASTGGPVALQKLLSALPADFPAPILVIQHMPASFTPAFAERLNGLCKIQVKHGVDGQRLEKGVAILAPGAKQMIVVPKQNTIRILDGDERLTYKPSVDVTFGSAAKAFPGKVLGVVLTGMGADGKEGCRLLRQSGSTVLTQSEDTCVVYGMPMAVDRAGYSNASIALDRLSDTILTGVM